MTMREDPEIPMGLGMALTQNPRALSAFAALDSGARACVLNRARGARSKAEMQRIADELAGGM